MSKKIERTKNNEVLGIEGTKEELNKLKRNIKLQNNFTSPEGDPENEGSLKDKLNDLIPLSEIGEFNNNGDFIVKEGIKGEDDTGSYILIRGEKYYNDITRSRNNDFIGLGYDIGKYTDNTGYIRLGHINGMVLEKGTEYRQNGKIYDGEWDLNNGFIKGIAKLPDADGIRIFQGTFDGFMPKDGILERYKDENLKYTYKGNFNNRLPEGTGTMWWPNEDTHIKMYEGKRKNGKYEGIGKYTYESGATYDGERIDGKKEGHGTYIGDKGVTYICEWSNDKPKEGEGTILRPNGDEYNGYILINDKGQPEKCYDSATFKKWRDKQINSGNPTSPNMSGKYTHQDGKYYEYSLTNGSVKEKSNDFITMFGDKDPKKDLSLQRGNIIYETNYHSDTNIEYRISSRKRSTQRKFNGTYYIFKDNTGHELKIPSSSSFGEKEAKHAGEIINMVRYVKETNKGENYTNYGIGLYYVNFSYGGSGVAGSSLVPTSESNIGTNLIIDVPQHFGGIDAGILATWLNNAKR